MRIPDLVALASAALLAACEESAPSNLAPSAAFAVRCGPYVCTFTNGSSDPDGTIERYTWDFGDESDPGTTRDAEHAYAVPGGRFAVTLTVVDDGGAAASASTLVDVGVGANVPPTASFTFVCGGFTCRFTSSSADGSEGGSVVSHAWQFGDGATSSEVNPRHTFDGRRTYRVSLAVTDNGGAQSRTYKDIALPAENPDGVDPRFSVSCADVECTFTDTSTGEGIIGWEWDFGDGETSRDRNPVHTYATVGPTVYTVTLTLTTSDLLSAVGTRDIEVTLGSIGKWSPRAPMPAGRQMMGTAALDGTLYVAGGNTNGTPDAEIFAYDPEVDGWRTIGTLRHAVWSPGMAAFGGKLYVVGGSDGGQGPLDGVNQVQIVNPATGNVSAGPPLPFPLSRASAVVLDGRLHVLGLFVDPDDLFCDFNCFISHHVLDPDTGTWSARRGPPALWEAGGAVAVGGRIYLVIGGQQEHLAEYDPATDEWTTVPGRPGQHGAQGSAVASLDGKLYILGGSSDFELAETAVRRFDPVTRAWEHVRPMTESRVNHGAAVIGGAIHVVGGYNAGITPSQERLTIE